MERYGGMSKKQDRTLTWLLEPADIGVRYLALRGAPTPAPAVRDPGPPGGLIARVLDHMGCRRLLA